VKKRWKQMKEDNEKQDDIGDPVVMAMYVIKKKREEWRMYFDQSE
jgi:hypothetical protein